LHGTRKEDPRLARLLDARPRLDAWRTWKIGESSRVYVLIATGLWQQILLVLDKETLDPLRTARRSRISKPWGDVDEDELL